MTDIDRVRQLIRDAPTDVILKVAARCDGHTIFAPAAFTELGLSSEVVDFATDTYRSDGSPKGTIFRGGRAVPELTGVYGLELLELIAHALGVEYRSCMGRGFQADAIRSALRQHFGQAEPRPSA